MSVSSDIKNEMSRASSPIDKELERCSKKMFKTQSTISDLCKNEPNLTLLSSKISSLLGNNGNTGGIINSSIVGNVPVDPLTGVSKSCTNLQTDDDDIDDSQDEEDRVDDKRLDDLEREDVKM